MAVTETQTAAASLDTALLRLGEHFAAGYMARPDEPPVMRFAMGIASHLQHVDLPPYNGEALYPCSGSLYARGAAVEWHYSSCLGYNPEILRAKLEATDDPQERAALQAVHEALKDYPHFGGYTHSIPNYRRIAQRAPSPRLAPGPAGTYPDAIPATRGDSGWYRGHSPEPERPTLSCRVHRC